METKQQGAAGGRCNLPNRFIWFSHPQHDNRQKAIDLQGVSAAVILAAGVGSRLRPLTADLPKCLLPIGPRAETILDMMLAQLTALGVPHIYIVTGFQSEKISRHVSDRWASTVIETIYNPDFDCMNNARSLLSTRSSLEGRSFVKFDADLVLQKDVLPRLFASATPSTIVLDQDSAMVNEDMKATLGKSSGCVSSFGKHLPNDSDGISIGVELIGAVHSQCVFEALDHCVYAQNRTDAYYEDAYDDVLGQGLEFGYVTTASQSWFEIDERAEYDEVRRVVASRPSDFFP